MSEVLKSYFHGTDMSIAEHATDLFGIVYPGHNDLSGGLTDVEAYAASYAKSKSKGIFPNPCVIEVGLPDSYVVDQGLIMGVGPGMARGFSTVDIVAINDTTTSFREFLRQKFGTLDTVEVGILKDQISLYRVKGQYIISVKKVDMSMIRAWLIR